MREELVASIRVEVRQHAWTAAFAEPSIVVGRGRGARLRIDGAGLAPRHARLDVLADAIEILPLDGAVRVDDRAVAGPVRASDASVIELGGARLRVNVVRRLVRREPTSHAFAIAAPQPWPARRWREQLAPDAQEHGLLAQLRESPGDRDARMVYADWLESRGELVRAEAVRTEGWADRHELVRDSTVEWRAIVAAAPISGCHREDCPGWWHELHATDDERRRTCARCAAQVRYVAPTDPPRDRILDDTPLVLDVDLASQAVDPDRFDALVRRAANPAWRIGRADDFAGRASLGGQTAWLISLDDDPSGLDRVYTVLLDGRRLQVVYGGNDAGFYRLDALPTYSRADLDVRGLDDATIVTWLQAVFHRLPPRVVGLS